MNKILLATVMALFTHAASAKMPAGCELVYNGTASMAGAQRTKYLQLGDYAKLDTELEALWREHQKGRRSDLMIVRDLYEMFQMSGRDMALLKEWAEKTPGSFFANLAYGGQLMEQAHEARGYQSAARTSKQQLAAMQAIQQRGLQYLEAARKLKPDSALPFGGLIVMAGTREGGYAVVPVLQAANKADPKNLSARVAAMSYLEPRWGGSMDQVEGIVTEAQQARLPEAQVNYLRFNLVMTKASNQEAIVGNKAAARELYREALRMCNNSETAESGLQRTGR
ncbi:DUF4034 domain-containing protein [Acidovorax sp.]|uniref:DUF4034 domain-containing protein n=1 Tax=Acidovorax sp. TaxID=1872122 RepID=UPI00391B2E04